MTSMRVSSISSTSSTSTHSLRAPLLLRPRNFQWFWNSAANPWTSEQWQKYSDIENEIIEDACNQKKFSVEIDEDRIVNLECMLEHNKHDESNYCPIKHVQVKQEHENLCFREDRFATSLPFPSMTSLPEPNDSEPHTSLIDLMQYFDLPRSYIKVALSGKNLTYADIVEEATQGLLTEGRKEGKEKEAQWLARKLEDVKDFDRNKDVFKDDMPAEIGETSVYLYKKQSFWYKLINRILRVPAEITAEHLKTLGPFCFLLNKYLQQQMPSDVFDRILSMLDGQPLNVRKYGDDILTVYRGLTLTDDERELLMDPMMGSIMFTSFTSTTKNREKAEIFGNTLFIMDLDTRDFFNHLCQCGAYIAHISQFPIEEEFLIKSVTSFKFVKYDYDNIRKKHILYLKLSF